MKKIVLLRHGESTWNKEKRFTGWVDVGLSEKSNPGRSESTEEVKVEFVSTKWYRC
jgi:2,3-bisphosphoglycerate-dependent phosphoglycerate mutase